MTADELKAWRKEHKLTQAALATLLGVHEMTVSQWENSGAGAPPYLHLALNELDRRLNQQPH